MRGGDRKGAQPRAAVLLRGKVKKRRARQAAPLRETKERFPDKGHRGANGALRRVPLRMTTLFWRVCSMSPPGGSLGAGAGARHGGQAGGLDGDAREIEKKHSQEWLCH